MRKASEDRLLRIARKQFKRCEDYEADFRRKFNEDVRFANADPDNNWQWPNDLYRNRQLQGKVTLTVNQVRTLNNLIINNIKKNPPGIVIRATGGKANADSAKVYSGWVREITRRCRFANIVTRAARFQVDGGVAYWRVYPEWEDEKSWSQRITISSIKNMTSVFLDPDAKEPDKRDAKFGFLFEDVLKDAVHRDYPQIKQTGASSNTIDGSYLVGWSSQTHYRVAEWYNLESKKDELVEYYGEDDNEPNSTYLSELPTEPIEEMGGKSIRDMILEDPMTRRRKVDRPMMKWRKVIGDNIVAEKDFPCRYVPLVQVVGDEVEVEGDLDRKGNTRLLKDAQRMLNYWLSAGTQGVALQTKSPWSVDVKAISGFENYYATSNVIDHAYLPYHSKDSEGNELQRPQKIAPAEWGAGFLTGMQIADKHLMTISGQREPTRDMESDNLQSGRAILTRKEQGETSTFGFRDNIDIAVAHTGRIILDMVSRVMDVKRSIRIVQRNGEDNEVIMDPSSKIAYDEQKIEGTEDQNQIVFNPHLGTYDVDADSGPDWPTQRAYTVEAMSTIIAHNQELWNVVGDMLVQNMDFPDADEMAERIKRTIPKHVLGEGPTPDMQVLIQQNEQLQKIIENFTALLAEANLKLKNKDEQTTVNVENAITKRIKEVGNAADDLKKLGLSEDATALIKQAVQEALSMRLPESAKNTEPDINLDGVNPQTADAAPPPGLPRPLPEKPIPVPLPDRKPLHPSGRIASDGAEYVETSPGKFARVGEPGATQ